MPGLGEKVYSTIYASDLKSEKAVHMYLITTFYKFVRYENAELQEIQALLKQKAQDLKILGLIVLGAEGMNATVAAASKESLEAFKNFVRQLVKDEALLFKDSQAESAPFRKFSVKERDEIVTLGTPDLFPDASKNHHLTPEQWNKVLKEEKDFLLVDTRNWYEYKIGSFKNAIDPKINQFTDFPAWFKQQAVPKDKKVLIFCTGGIRCEKGILELQREGFENVFQLEGGILKYLEQFPNDEFQGECFVFDHRVAVDQALNPSKKYGLCPHCGQPSEEKVECKRCDFETLICVDCAKLEWKKDTCSKNCAYHYKLHPERKAPHQVVPHEVERGLFNAK
jgi:UPF0176 protein